MNDSKEILKGIVQQASMMVTYYKALIAEGMSEKDALRLTIAYQDSQIKAVTMANLEREKTIRVSGSGQIN